LIKIHRFASAFCALLILLLAIAGCHHARVMKPANSLAPANSVIPFQNTDSIALVRVKLAQADALKRGKPQEMTVIVQYTLVSRNDAFLRLSLDQFSNRESCVTPEASAGPFALVSLSAREIQMSRGTHTVEIQMTWPGDTGEGTDGHIFGSGAVSFQASMRTRRPNYEFLTRRFGTEYCMRF
jgi:hypothetical protein